jgi:MFS family permease
VGESLSQPDAIARDAARHLRHNLRCSVTDGSAYMVMVGLAETFFPLFILALFADVVASGLVLTFPLFLAAVLQLAAPWLVARAGSYRSVVTVTAWLQAAICVPLAIIAFTGFGPLWLVFVLITIYHAGAAIGGPPWLSMMSVLVPTHLRARFLARRNRMLQAGSIAGVVIGACVLEFMPKALAAASITLPQHWLDKPTLPAFGLLFSLAAIARAVSAIYLGRHKEPFGASHAMHAMSPREMVDRVRTGKGRSLIAFLCAFQFAAMIGSPYFHAYVREQGQATFLEWAGLIVIWMLGRALTVTWAGEIARNHGHKRLLLIGAVLMVPIPALWALSTDLVWIAVAQLLAGMALACWELAVWLSTLEVFDERERTSMLAKFGLLNWLSGTLGSWAGGGVLGNFGNDRAAFAWVFVASTVARAALAVAIARYTRPRNL